MITKAIRPEDLIADGSDYTQINGMQVRKGTVAAFLANIDLLENPNSSTEVKNQALCALNELAPSIVAVRLHHHVNFKNKVAEEIIQQAAQQA